MTDHSQQAAFDDEFENPREGPVGLHRGRKSRGARFRPYAVTAVAAIVVALCAWLVWSGKLQSASTNSDATRPTSSVRTASSAQKAPSSSSSSSADSTTTAGVAPSNSSSDSSNTPSSTATIHNTTSQSSATSSASSTPNYSSQVTIYNANGAAGLAARTASVLESVGYTNVQAKNYSGTRPQADVVWYSSASEKTTADAVAQKLGISAVVQQNSALQSPVEVILVTD
ncbi:MAG: LytR C-terminal domain-containing protein [Bifidobacteriaceae bacterium]|nr:LytR C-terminal domain-containing protein [Bifidobacteriaceae bacterium]